jgi:hypothetical protein
MTTAQRADQLRRHPLPIVTPERQCCGRCDAFSERLPSAKEWGACRHTQHPESAQQHRDNGKNCCKFVPMVAYPCALPPGPPLDTPDHLEALRAVA